MRYWSLKDTGFLSETYPVKDFFCWKIQEIVQAHRCDSTVACAIQSEIKIKKKSSLDKKVQMVWEMY